MISEFRIIRQDELSLLESKISFSPPSNFLADRFPSAACPYCVTQQDKTDLCNNCSSKSMALFVGADIDNKEYYYLDSDN